jgi:hypothetical protein
VAQDYDLTGVVISPSGKSAGLVICLSGATFKNIPLSPLLKSAKPLG